MFVLARRALLLSFALGYAFHANDQGLQQEGAVCEAGSDCDADESTSEAASNDHNIGFPSVSDPMDTGMPLCQAKEQENTWYQYLSKNYMNVFPDGNRNFGGAKWFKFCESKFCPQDNQCDRERMACCTHSYCPYSGALAGGAARWHNQVLLDYCVHLGEKELGIVSMCCNPCTCTLSPDINPQDMRVQTYKGMRVLFEQSCDECAALKARMQPCTCSNANEFKPVVVLTNCSDDRQALFGRVHDDQHWKTCSEDSWDPMRGKYGAGRKRSVQGSP